MMLTATAAEAAYLRAIDCASAVYQAEVECATADARARWERELRAAGRALRRA
jgi:hypothetical protein